MQDNGIKISINPTTGGLELFVNSTRIEGTRSITIQQNEETGLNEDENYMIINAIFYAKGLVLKPN